MAYFIVFIGALLRVIPHPANFAPIGALALFGAVYLNKRVALLLPILAMVVSDLFIGFDSAGSRLMVYGAFLIIGLVGLLVRKHKNVYTIVGGSLTASVIFFLITNFAFFYPVNMYDHGWSGIVTAYTNGIPFFRNTLVSDLLYTGVFFGAYEAVSAWSKRKSEVGISKTETL